VTKTKDPDTLQDNVPDEVRAAYEEFLKDERREEPRAPVRMPVRVEPVGNASAAFDARTSNLGASGVCILTDHDCEVGVPLQIRISLSEGRTIEVVGNVSWVHRGAAIGVHFEQVAPEVEEEIEALVNDALTATPPPMKPSSG
jgi:hypothetical protein